MAKMLRCRLVLLVSLLVFLGVWGCVSQEVVSQWSVSQALVSPELLRAGNLEMLWQKELPIRQTESLERLFILGNRIYAFSDRNHIFSLNRANGNVIFSRSFGPAGFPVLGLELYEDEVLSIVGNKLVEINPSTGTERRAKRLAINAICPAARNSLYFYVGGADRRVHVLRAEDKVQVFEVAAEDDSKITSIVADESFFVFATDSGSCVSIAPDRPERLWQFVDAAGSIVGPIVKDAKSLFFASEDTNVYRINIRTGGLDWKHQTAAVLDKAPVVTEGVVYQYVRDKGLTAIDKGSGKFMWQVPKGVELLAEADEKAYVITRIGELVVMDNSRAKRLYSINFARVSRYAANIADSKIYIADKDGRIACLKPIE